MIFDWDTHTDRRSMKHFLRFGGTSKAALAGAILLSVGQGASAQGLGDSIPAGSPLSMGGNGSGLSNDQGAKTTISRPAPTSSAPYSPPVIQSATHTGDQAAGAQDAARLSADLARLRRPASPGEYESWLQQVTGRKIKRYGSDLLIPGARDFSVPATSTVPPDYALNVGDTVAIALSGSVEGSADFEIDREGRIFLPNVGAVSLAGVRYRDLKDRVVAAVGRKYRGFDVSVSIQRLRGVRVYVTGFANQPGSYTVNSLSTLVNAVLAAGGPSAGGSFRNVKLRRNGVEVADFDLYQLLRKGNRAFDPVLQNEDVIYIPEVGSQVAVIGSVNEEAIYEARDHESLDDLLKLAGGPTNVADAGRLILYRLTDQDTVGSREIKGPGFATEVANGDIVQILPQGTLVRPLERQQAIVRVEGEVNQPGNYYVAPNTPLSDVIKLAGGLTSRAYVFGTRFSRESVRAQQRRSFLEAIEQMEMTLAAAPVAGDSLTDAGQRQAQIVAARSFVDQLRRKEPDGRMVIDIKFDATALPGNLALENNDHIVIPPRVDTVGVFGAVNRPASFLLDTQKRKRVRAYVEEAGGTIRGADRGNIFVVRANGAVLTKRRGAMEAYVLPGDTVLVPIRSQSSSILAKIRDITQILYQFGLSAAAVAAIQN